LPQRTENAKEAGLMAPAFPPVSATRMPGSGYREDSLDEAIKHDTPVIGVDG
jgi:hypothetical protein